MEKFGELGCIKVVVYRYEKTGDVLQPSSKRRPLLTDEAIPEKQAAKRTADLGVK